MFPWNLNSKIKIKLNLYLYLILIQLININFEIYVFTLLDSYRDRTHGCFGPILLYTTFSSFRNLFFYNNIKIFILFYFFLGIKIFKHLMITALALALVLSISHDKSFGERLWWHQSHSVMTLLFLSMLFALATLHNQPTYSSIFIFFLMSWVVFWIPSILALISFVLPTKATQIRILTFFFLNNIFLLNLMKYNK